MVALGIGFCTGVGVVTTCTYCIFSWRRLGRDPRRLRHKTLSHFTLCPAVSVSHAVVAEDRCSLAAVGIATLRVPLFGILGSMPRSCIVPSCVPSCCSCRIALRGAFCILCLCGRFVRSSCMSLAPPLLVSYIPSLVSFLQFAVLWFVYPHILTFYRLSAFVSRCVRCSRICSTGCPVAFCSIASLAFSASGPALTYFMAVGGYRISVM